MSLWYIVSDIITGVKASTLLRSARAQSGLSQRELGRRAGSTQASVSRVERGVVSPTVDTLERLVRSCGAELALVPRPGDGVDRTLIRERLRLSPGERIREAEREWGETEAFRRAIQRQG